MSSEKYKAATNALADLIRSELSGEHASLARVGLLVEVAQRLEMIGPPPEPLSSPDAVAAGAPTTDAVFPDSPPVFYPIGGPPPREPPPRARLRSGRSPDKELVSVIFDESFTKVAPLLDSAQGYYEAHRAESQARQLHCLIDARGQMQLRGAAKGEVEKITRKIEALLGKGELRSVTDLRDVSNQSPLDEEPQVETGGNVPAEPSI